MKTKTLLNVPDLIVAVKPLVRIQVSADDIFELIGSGDVRPMGVVQRMPVFDLDQIADIAAIIKQRKE